MRKEYITPELEVVKITMKDVIMASIIEETLPEVIGGGGGSSSVLDDDDL